MFKQKRILNLFKYNFRSFSNKPEFLFENRLNRINSPSQNNIEDLKNYMKILNEKTNQDNLEIKNELFSKYDNNNSDILKVFLASQEVNQTNLDNSSTLLAVFLNKLSSYNEKARIMIVNSNKKTNLNIIKNLTLLLIWITGLAYLFGEKRKKNISINEIINNYNKKQLIEKISTIDYALINTLETKISDFIGSKFKVTCFIMSRNVKNLEELINFLDRDESNNKIDKSTGYQTIYLDLDKIKLSADFNQIILEKLKTNNSLDLDKLTYDKTALINYINNNNILLILDNFNSKRDSALLNSNILDKQINRKFIIVGHNNETAKESIRNNINIDFIDVESDSKFKDFILNKEENYQINSLTDQELKELESYFEVIDLDLISNLENNKSELKNNREILSI